MKYAVIGTGAIGGYYGGRLAHHGLDVHFLLHSDYQHVNQHGLKVDSPTGNFQIPVNAYADAADMPQCDVALVSLKTTHNHLLAELLPQVVKADGIVVMLQNGFGVEQAAAAVMPDATVIGGLCFICSTKLGPGHIDHSDYGMVNFAQYTADESPAGITPEVSRIAEDFRNSGIETQTSDNLAQVRWTKLVWNIPYNGLSVVLDTSTQALMSNPHSLALVQALMLEVIAAANACGQTLSDELPSKCWRIPPR